MGKMTFLDLQRQITQTRKARKGISNRRDYFKDISGKEEKAIKEIYKRTLRIANEIIKHYEETGIYDPAEKISVMFGKSKIDETSNLKKENHKLKVEIESLKKQIEDVKEKFCRGGRKAYDDTMAQAVKMARERGETWRGLSKRLGISTTTAQKLYRI